MAMRDSVETRDKLMLMREMERSRGLYEQYESEMTIEGYKAELNSLYNLINDYLFERMQFSKVGKKD